MSILLIPQHVQIDVRFSIDDGLLSLLQSIVDAGSDRAAAAKLSAEAKATTDALKAAIPAA